MKLEKRSVPGSIRVDNPVVTRSKMRSPRFGDITCYGQMYFVRVSARKRNPSAHAPNAQSWPRWTAADPRASRSTFILSVETVRSLRRLAAAGLIQLIWIRLNWPCALRAGVKEEGEECDCGSEYQCSKQSCCYGRTGTYPCRKTGFACGKRKSGAGLTKGDHSLITILLMCAAALYYFK
jgi:hypothetical protein